MKRVVCPALMLAFAACADGALAPAPSVPNAAETSLAPLEPTLPELSATRRLRRITLTLRGKEPSLAEYEALQALPAAGVEAALDRAVDEALVSDDFYRQMLTWGHDTLRIASYAPGVPGGVGGWAGSQAAELNRCAPGTVHAGAYAFSKDNLCGTAGALATTVEPWWAPGTAVRVLGRAGSGLRSDNGKDCGRVSVRNGDGRGLPRADAPNCSCGPNLVYCLPVATLKAYSAGGSADHATNYYGEGQRRGFWEEPARLFAHVVVKDRPFTDLVLADYSVVTRKVAHAYVRAGRQTGNVQLDDSSWWRAFPDEGWHETRMESLWPQMLADRNYRFDPRVDTGAMQGVPWAGVLSTLGANGSFLRERIRAARWLEIFACQVFTSAPPGVTFNAFQKDPATEGSCQHCHVAIDPAAIHFKRLHIPLVGEVILGGAGYSWSNIQGSYGVDLGARLRSEFLPSTRLTPVSDAVAAAKPDALFIDFLPPGPGNTLLGSESDGTIGPLGFGKLVVKSGDFDRCAVRRLHERFLSRPIDVVAESQRLTSLVERFVAGGRKVRPFVKVLFAEPDHRRGL